MMSNKAAITCDDVGTRVPPIFYGEITKSSENKQSKQSVHQAPPLAWLTYKRKPYLPIRGQSFAIWRSKQHLVLAPHLSNASMLLCPAPSTQKGFALHFVGVARNSSCPCQKGTTSSLTTKSSRGTSGCNGDDN